MTSQSQQFDYDVLIIGAGPGGLTTALYAARANLKVAFIERDAPGGKMVKTTRIQNWPGDVEVAGADLALRMFSHAKSLGAQYLYGEVVTLKPVNELIAVTLASNKVITARFVVIATGLVERVPHWITGITTWENRGVSYCATCDGPLYKDKVIGVIGGGNSAIEESLFLAQLAREVLVFIRNPSDLTADQRSVTLLRTKPNVKLLFNAEVKELHGTYVLSSALVSVNGKPQTMALAALFPYIGQAPMTKFLAGLNITDEGGYVLANEETLETAIPNLFVVGDVRHKHIRQIATAVADGVIVSKSIAAKV